jgi:hypothetical protein
VLEARGAAGVFTAFFSTTVVVSASVHSFLGGGVSRTAPAPAAAVETEEGLVPPPAAVPSPLPLLGEEEEPKPPAALFISSFCSGTTSSSIINFLLAALAMDAARLAADASSLALAGVMEFSFSAA